MHIEHDIRQITPNPGYEISFNLWNYACPWTLQSLTSLYFI